MASTAVLAVSVIARTNSFRAGLAGASKSLSTFASGAVATAGKIGAFGASLAGLAGAAGLVGAVNSGRQAIDTLGALAARAGVSAGALSELQFVAQQTDVSNEALVGSIIKMNRSLGDAIIKGGASAEAFNSLGLNINELAGLRVEDRFFRIISALRGIKNSAEQASLGGAIFSRGFANIKPLVDTSALAIQGFISDARGIGAAISDAGVAQVGEMDNALNRVSSLFEAIKNQVTVALAPAITGLATSFIDWAVRGGGAVGLVSAGLEKAANVAAFFSGIMDVFSTTWLSLKSIVQVATVGILQAISAIASGLNATIGSVARLVGFESLGAALEQTAARYAAITESAKADLSALTAQTQAAFAGADFAGRGDAGIAGALRTARSDFLATSAGQAGQSQLQRGTQEFTSRQLDTTNELLRRLIGAPSTGAVFQ